METLGTERASLKVSSGRLERELAAERGLTEQLQKVCCVRICVLLKCLRSSKPTRLLGAC